jgi:hypothetical protein
MSLPALAHIPFGVVAQFACGSALKKGQDGKDEQIEIQGNYRDELPAVIVDKLKVRATPLHDTCAHAMRARAGRNHAQCYSRALRQLSLDNISILIDGKKVKAAEVVQ